MTADDRADVRASLFAVSQSSKSSLARVLHMMQESGLLTDEKLGKSLRDERRQIEDSVKRHAEADTPYGKVVQSMDIGLNDRWEFIHPFALIYHLSSMSESFADFFDKAVSSAGGCLRLLVYGDEFTPGNPNRVDGGRSLMAIYYTFIDFPTWLVNRSDAWFAFGVLRSRLLHRCEFGHSAFLAKILRLFFFDGLANLSNGCFYVHRGKHKRYTGRFGGILADEKGLKEFFAIKGQAGWKPCLSCKNVHNFLHRQSPPPDGSWEVGLDVVDRTRLEYNTNSIVFAMVDRVNNPRLSKIELEKLEKILGVNRNPEGILACPLLRGIVRPIEHYVRDWQHTLASHGVIGSHLAGLFGALKRRDISWNGIADFSQLCCFPKSYGKVDRAWFTQKYVKDQFVSAFASQALQMLPVVCLYMFIHRDNESFIDLNRDSQCIGHLMFVVSALQHCKDFDDRIATLLESRIDLWGRLFVDLYPAELVKVKFHHFFGHLIADIRRMGKVIGCFGTERKHKDVKRGVLFSFNHVEHTTTFSFLNAYCHDVIHGKCVFEPRRLINPRTVDMPPHRLTTSKKIELEIGTILATDIIIAKGDASNEKIVGQVERFFSDDRRSSCVVEVHMYRRIAEHVNAVVISEWAVNDPQQIFIDASMVVGTVVFVRHKRDKILVIEPSFL